MFIYKRRSLILSVTLGLLLLSGCNVFEGFYEAGTSSDPTILAADAEAALASGDAERAIEYAEKALEKDSTYIPAANVLASAELKKAKVDIVTLTEFVDVLTLEAEATLESKLSAPMLAKTDASTCPATTSYECDFCEAGKTGSYEQVIYTDLEAYRRLRDAHDTFERIDEVYHALLYELTLELDRLGHNLERMADVFSTPVGRGHAWTALTDRGAELGVENPGRLTSQVLTTLSVSVLGRSIGQLTSQAERQQIAIYKVSPGTSSETFSYCASSLETVEEYIDGSVCQTVARLQFAVDMLRARQENFAGAATGEDDPIQLLIDGTDEALEEYRNSESYGRCGGI